MLVATPTHHSQWTDHLTYITYVLDSPGEALIMMRRLAIALLALFLARHSYLPASEELLKERTISSERLLRGEKWVNPWKEMLDMRTSITDTHLILTCDAWIGKCCACDWWTCRPWTRWPSAAADPTPRRRYAASFHAWWWLCSASRRSSWPLRSVL